MSLAASHWLMSLAFKRFRVGNFGITLAPKIYTISEAESICLRYVLAWFISPLSDGTTCPGHGNQVKH